MPSLITVRRGHQLVHINDPAIAREFVFASQDQTTLDDAVSRVAKIALDALQQLSGQNSSGIHAAVAAAATTEAAAATFILWRSVRNSR